jgi:hypothetical protein
MNHESIRQLLFYFARDTASQEEEIAENLDMPLHELMGFLYEDVAVNDSTLVRIRDYLSEQYRKRDESMIIKFKDRDDREY